MTDQTPDSKITNLVKAIYSTGFVDGQNNEYSDDGERFQLRAATQLQQLIDSAVLAELKKLQLEGGHIPDEQCCGLCDRIEDLGRV